MNEPRATRYQRLKRRADVAAALSSGAMLAVIALTPAAAILAGVADTIASTLPPAARTFVSLAIFLTFVVVVCELASLPFTLYLRLRVDGRYGRAASSVEDVLAGQAQTLVLALPAAVGIGGLVQLSSLIFGAWWWAAAGIALAVLLFLAIQAAPPLLAWLTGARRLDRDDLLERLAALARRARVTIDEIYVLPTGSSSGMTALVSGLGRRRYIFISAELVRHWSDDEIAVVLAHELGHHAHGDLWRTLALDATALSAGLLFSHVALRGVGAMFGLTGAADLAALPFIALTAALGWTAATPLRHAFSRRQERRADAFALALTGGADAFDTAIRRLASRHLAEERPSVLARWLFHAHPTVAERLDYTRVYRGLRSN